jgi:hypothetical protein
MFSCDSASMVHQENVPIFSGMAKAKKREEIREGDWLDLRVTVERTWPDGRVTVLIDDAGGNARRHTIKENSDQIVAVLKPA